MATFLKMPGWSIEFRTEEIRVESIGPVLDPDWRFVDANGHEHFYDEGYPTLDWVEDVPAGFDADGEEWNAEGHYECLLCREEIEPGSISPPPYGSTVPGPSHAIAVGPDSQRHNLSADQAATIVATPPADIPAVLEGWFPTL